MIVYACSSNPGKLREFRIAAESAAGIEIEALPGLKDMRPPEETGSTFEENAGLKAANYSRFTSAPVFADDSGLEAAALGGAPGVISARYAGPNATDQENNKLLLQQLEGTRDRGARFVAIIAVARAGRVLNTFRGEIPGEILYAPRGLGGFGYDPLFFYPPFARTLAEVTPDEKFSVSHRGKALRAMLAWLPQYFLQAEGK